jgi:glucokinase
MLTCQKYSRVEKSPNEQWTVRSRSPTAAAARQAPSTNAAKFATECHRPRDNSECLAQATPDSEKLTVCPAVSSAKRSDARVLKRERLYRHRDLRYMDGWGQGQFVLPRPNYASVPGVGKRPATGGEPAPEAGAWPERCLVSPAREAKGGQGDEVEEGQDGGVERGQDGGPSAIVVGVDLGGTGTRIVGCAGREVLDQCDVLTADLGQGSIDERLDRLATLAASIVGEDAKLVGVGIGASGPIDARAGIIVNPDTLPRFSGFPLVAGLEDRLGVPVVLENDAVTAAVGEYRYGAGRGCERLLVVTLGTGVGVALIDRGLPFRDASGQHPDAGHLPVFDDGRRCYCGLTGCWEPAISRSSLESRTRSTVGEPDLDEAERLLATAPDDSLVAVLRDFGQAVGRGLEVLNVVYGAERIVICGSISRFLPYFADVLQEEFRRAPGYRRDVPVLATALGDYGGAIGAALLPVMAKARASSSSLERRDS